MKIYLQTQRVSVPTAFVTKGRQRVKQHDNNVIYLKNGDEFEIELFNPTSNKVLTKITVNGNSIGSGEGIVVRPGERVFLERYLDDAKKFLFQTYEVDAKDPNVQNAIKLNGIVDIEFYDEYKEPYVVTYPAVYHYHHYYHPYHPQYYPPTWTYYSTGNTGGSFSTTGTAYANSTSFTSGNQSQSISKSNETQDAATFYCNTGDLSLKSESKPETKETGRIEKGSVSDQSFMYDSTSFNYYCNWKYTWKILPDSQKVFVKEDLKVFCTSCGMKRKKINHVFCPNCGNKF